MPCEVKYLFSDAETDGGVGWNVVVVLVVRWLYQVGMEPWAWYECT